MTFLKNQFFRETPLLPSKTSRTKTLTPVILQVKRDETLAAVLMLGFFEVRGLFCLINSTINRFLQTLTTYRSWTAWGSHNEGAVALVKLRGADNLKTKAGCQLLAAVRTQTVSTSGTAFILNLMQTSWSGACLSEKISINRSTGSP